MNSTPQGVCKRLTTADYTSIMTTSFAELPGVLVAYFLIDTIGRRRAILAQLSIATLAFASLCACAGKTASSVFMFVSRGLLMSSLQTVFIYSAEVFPTDVRAMGVGLVCLFGRVGAIITPFVAQVLVHWSFRWTIGAYVIPLVVCTCSVLLLKIETKERILQDSTVADGSFQ